MKVKEIKSLRSSTGLSQIKFAKRFGIPRRTLEDWEQGLRKCPEYVFEMIEYLVKTDYHSPRSTEEE